MTDTEKKMEILFNTLSELQEETELTLSKEAADVFSQMTDDFFQKIIPPESES